MKTKRIEFVASPEFKARLQEVAAIEGVSVGELTRLQFETSDEEKELARLITTLKKATAEGADKLSNVNQEVDAIVLDLQSRRNSPEREVAFK